MIRSRSNQPQTALDKDRSSLTALNVSGLVDLNVLFTLLMSAAAIAIFVFGLMLQRRREYVTLRAIGTQARQVRALVVGEAGAVVVCGLAAAIVVGTVMAFLLVHILRPLFVLDPGHDPARWRDRTADYARARSCARLRTRRDRDPATPRTRGAAP